MQTRIKIIVPSLILLGALSPSAYAVAPQGVGTNQLIGFLSNLAFETDKQLDNVLAMQTPAAAPNSAGTTNTLMGRNLNYLLTGYNGYGTNNTCSKNLQSAVGSGGANMSDYYNTISMLQDELRGTAGKNVANNYPLAVQMSYLIALRRLRIPAQLRHSPGYDFVNNTGLKTVYDFAGMNTSNDTFNGLGNNLILTAKLNACSQAMSTQSSNKTPNPAAKTCSGKGKGSVLDMTKQMLKAIKNANLTVKATALGLTTQDVNSMDPTNPKDITNIQKLFADLISLQEQAVLTAIVEHYKLQAPAFSPFSFDSLVGSTNLIPTSANAACPAIPSNYGNASTATETVPLPEQRRHAANAFVRTVSNLAASGAAHPPSIPLATALSGLEKQTDPKKIAAALKARQQMESGIIQSQKAYVNERSKLVAAKSIGLSNFYWMLSQRSTPATAKVPGLKNPSMQDLEAYQAQWRLLPKPKDPSSGETSPAWVTSIARGSPTNATRETTYLLAEIRQQMYKNQLLMERMLATLSAMQIAALNNNSENVRNLYQGVKTEVNNYLSQGGASPSATMAGPSLSKASAEMKNRSTPTS